MSFEQALELANRFRLGTILTPDEVRQESSRLDKPIGFDGYALSIPVPAWLVSVLEAADGPPHLAVNVLHREGHVDHLLVLVLQSGSTQLRILMQASAEPVQRYLTDSLHNDQCRLLLEAERTHTSALMTLPLLRRIEAPLVQLIREASPSADTARQHAMQCVSLSRIEALSSLIEGKEVSDCVTVFVGDTDALLRGANEVSSRSNPKQADEEGSANVETPTVH